MVYSLGVHLGTTSVAAAAAEGTRVDMVRLGERSVVAGAALYQRADGRMIAGDAAARRHHLQPDRVVREIRRRLGDPTPIIIGRTAYAAPVLLAHLAGDAVSRARAVYGHAPAVVVLTRPASWGPYRRELFDEVPLLAGLSTTRTVTAPVAAAAHYAARRRVDDGAVVAVYHLGGATCEVTILRRHADDFDVLGSPESIERLGGSDIDEAILSYVNRATDGAVAELDTDDRLITPVLARLHHDCVLAKEALSVETSAVVPLFLPDRPVETTLTRTAFEDLIRPLLEPTMDALQRALTSADVRPANLSAVFLTGGSTRIPLVGRMVSDLVGCPVVINTHPEFVLALGAARLAARIQETKARPSTDDAVPGDRTDADRAAASQILPTSVAVATGARRPPVHSLGRRTATAPGAPPQPEPVTRARGDKSTKPLGTRAARIAFLAVVATLVLVAGVIALLIVFLHRVGVIGGHSTATFVPTSVPASSSTVDPTWPAG
jgi:molecular chaperone DnaK (HSP70)